MTANIATLTSKGQITIPKKIREALNLQEKDQVLFVLDDERAILLPLRRRPLQELRGALPATRPYPGMDAIRAEVQRNLGDLAPDEAEA